MKKYINRKVTAVIAITTVLFSCSGQESSTINLGNQLTGYVSSFTSSSMGSDLANDTLYVVNDATRRIYGIAMDKFEITREFKSPVGESGGDPMGLIAGPDGKSMIVIAKNQYAIVRQDDSVQVNPVRMQGRIQSYAFSKDAGVLVMSDHLGSLALIKIADDGSVGESLLVGGILPESYKRIKSAVVIPGTEKMILLTDESDLYVLDLSGSIKAQELQISPVQLPRVMQVDSIMPIPGNADRILVREFRTLAIVDYVAGEIIEEVTPDETMSFVAEFSSRWPHVAFAKSNQSYYPNFSNGTESTKGITVYMVGPKGNISKHKLNVEYGTPVQSYVDAAGETITYLSFLGGSVGRVSKVRLSDSLFLGHVDQLSVGKVALTEKHVVVVQKSVMGAMSRIETLRPENVVTLEGFNLENIKRAAN
ncbi:MAG: hypothetical protein EBU49_01305 [Proteobacteria bacterium]|nr:hypothetical protein [Pseudomonadota bacterium]